MEVSIGEASPALTVCWMIPCPIRNPISAIVGKSDCKVFSIELIKLGGSSESKEVLDN
jgi:hypothetical protein